MTKAILHITYTDGSNPFIMAASLKQLKEEYDFQISCGKNFINSATVTLNGRTYYASDLF